MKHLILWKISLNSDIHDRIYYGIIIENLNMPFVITAVILFILYIFREKIKSMLEGVTPKDAKKYFLITITAAGLIQFSLVIFIKTIPISDSRVYIDLAQRLFLTGKYINSDGSPSNFLPPGLPVYLTFLMHLTKDYYIWAEILNILFSFWIAYIFFDLAYDLMSPGSAVAAVFLFAFFPNNLFSSNIILTDYPFMLILWTIIWILLKHKSDKYSYILIGLLSGVLTYLRPSGIMIPILILIYLIKFVSSRKALFMFLQITAACLLILAPWTIRNYMIFGNFMPVSSNGGYNFLMGNHPDATGTVNFDFKYDFSADESTESRSAFLLGIKNIINYPVEAVARLPKKIFYAYYRGDSSITWSLKETENKMSGLLLSLIFFISNLYFYVIIFVSLIALILKYPFGEKTKFGFLITSVYVFFILLILVFFGTERFLIPVIPVHFLLAGKYFSEYLNS